MSDLVKALLLGLVEGLTEFVPVSSTGHLILSGELLDFVGEREKAFEVFIQAGAILAVVVLYWRRFKNLYLGLFPLRQWLTPDTYRKVEPGLSGRAGIINITLATLPALVAGGLLGKQSKELFFPSSVALALITGGVAFLLIEHFFGKDQRETKLTPRICLLIGVFQCLALWPGISRSGATIIGALALGVPRQIAAEFIFIIAVPVITAAALLDLYKSLHLLSVADIPVFATGLIVSFIAGMVSIKVFIAVLKRYTLRPFAYYRIVLGALVLILMS